MIAPDRRIASFIGAALLVVIGCNLALSRSIGAAEQPDPASTPEPVDFLTQVRPLLSDNCFKCHGPDPAVRKADLRLDTLEGLTADLGGYSAVAPGDPGESELIARITATDADERMPPPDTGKTLTPEQINLLRRWVKRGAPFERHWAFVPPVRPPLPTVNDTAWVANPIDAFVLAHLERERLTPSEPADRITLLRRLHLDLTGLPPTIEEADAFLADPSPDAYTRAVEGLLASPHYGEKWARWWLDAARYADSDGFEKDKTRFVWFYRDWVIQALNDDKPYDRFIIEQIAGDLLGDGDQDSLVATGFLRNSMVNEEGGIDPEQFRMEAMFDRMDAIGKSVLGLTIQCAQCHTHKFDPITHREYYQLFALINDAHEGNVSVYTPEQQRERARILSEIAAIEEQLRHTTPDWADRMSSWEASVKGNQPEWTVITPEPEANSTGGQKYLPQPDGSFLAQGYAPTKHTVHFEMMLEPNPEPIRAFRIELLRDPNLPHGGPGRSIFGTGALSEFQVAVASPAEPGKLDRRKFTSATADVNPPRTPLAPTYHDKSDKTRHTGPVEYAVDGDDLTAWSHDIGPGRRNNPFKAVFVPEQPIDRSQGAILHIYLKQNHGGWNSDDNQNHNFGRFRLSVTSAENAAADPLPAHVRRIIENVPAGMQSKQQQRAVFGYFRTTVHEWAEANDRIEQLWAEHPEPQSQLVLLSRGEARETHLLERGDFLKPRDAVEPGVPEFLHPMQESDEPARLRFARWLVDRDSPTTARVIVNRVWQAYFGTGLVETAEDLGSQAPAPSHPDLLDYLAVEFMESGWSLKHLHRLIVSSNTYRQSSAVTPDLLRRDPYNRLLARGPRLRVDAEIVRDIALAASGLLDPAVGGPSVYPPIPAFMVEPPVSYGPKPWGSGADNADKSGRYRRGLYVFRYRSLPYPVLATFDAPTGEAACVRRTRSNTPLQALVTLNEPVFMEAARALALRAATETADSDSASDSAALTRMVRLCVSRNPTDSELAVLTDLVKSQYDRFAADESAAWTLLTGGDEADRPTLPPPLTPAQAAAYTVAARVILNLDETITKP